MKRYVTFIETKVFTRRIAGLIDDDDFAEFQTELAQNPEKGPVIEGTGGLRKIRWKLKGRGKSGGLRIIYLNIRVQERIHLVFVFAKDESDDLTAGQKKELKAIVSTIKREHGK
jgi:hypothetical protein